MAAPLKSNKQHAADLAAVSLAGIRPLVFNSVVVASGNENSYTITRQSANRVICFYSGNANLDIRTDLNDTAEATGFPIAPGVYFSYEVEVGDVVSFFNTTGAAITIYIAEIR